jgi:phosphoenolpyruvate carboxylase
VNQAEKHEILRINRQRARDATPEYPRAESIDAAVARLKVYGHDLEAVLALVGRLDIQPTLTAHPTEARRRTILRKQRRVADLLEEMRRPDAIPAEVEEATLQLRQQLALLLDTDDVRPRRPTVQEEVEQGLYFLQGSIPETAPRIEADLHRALERHYGKAIDRGGGGGAGGPVDALRHPPRIGLHWRSWIGGDADGNPAVTAEVTRWTLDRHRSAALELQRAELARLREELSISEHRVPTPRPLEGRLRRLEADLPPDLLAPYAREPYRRLLTAWIHRLDGLLEEVRETGGVRSREPTQTGKAPPPPRRSWWRTWNWWPAPWRPRASRASPVTAASPAPSTLPGPSASTWPPWTCGGTAPSTRRPWRPSSGRPASARTTRRFRRRSG